MEKESVKNQKTENAETSEIPGSKATKKLKISSTNSVGSDSSNVVSSTNLGGNDKIAVIRIRGITGVRYDIDNTLDKLNLYKKNYCVVVPKTSAYMGMIKKVKDYVTWGDIEESTYNTLIEKRAEEYTGRVTDRKGKIKWLTAIN